MLTRYKAAADALAQPIVRACLWLRLSPTTITFLSLVLVAASCALLLITRRILLFCVLVTVASLLDLIDGAVARASGRVTKRGSYLDAMCDRYGEALVLVSVAVVTGYWLLSLALLAGALLTSYAKARAAMEVSIANTEWPDLMERVERGIVYVIGLAASALVSWRPMGHDLFWWTLLVLAVLTHVTVLQRIRRALRFIRARG